MRTGSPWLILLGLALTNTSYCQLLERVRKVFAVTRREQRFFVLSEALLEIRMWDLREDGRASKTFEGSSGCECIRWNMHNELLFASGHAGGEVRIWDTRVSEVLPSVLSDVTEVAILSLL
jgi:WD40 repeat protein